ncbi:MAG: hypothetical protein ACLFPH_05125 [Bacteroidales bacterium]
MGIKKKIELTEEESLMVAGFAGGIGLSGNAYGALAATIWYKMLEWGKKIKTNLNQCLISPIRKRFY